MQNGHFPSKIALRLKKVGYKLSLRESRQRHSCKAFIGLSIRAKMVDGDVPFYVKIGTSLQNADFQSIFAHSASVVTPSTKVQLTLK